MTLVVRPVRASEPAELEAVGELTYAAYAADGFVTEDDEYADHLRDAASRAAQAELYVAVDPDGRIAGTVTYCPADSRFRELAGPGEGEFRMLAVAPHARGRGVGEALVRTCIERAEELGCSALVLSSMPSQTSAHRVYGRIGFHRTPDLDWSPVAGVDLLGYRLELGVPRAVRSP